MKTVVVLTKEDYDVMVAILENAISDANTMNDSYLKHKLTERLEELLRIMTKGDEK